MQIKKILFIFLFILGISFAGAKEITDMGGNKIVVPDKITKIFGSAPPTTFMVSVFNPELLVGLNFPSFNKNNFGDKYYLGEKFMDLPVFGGWQGSQKGASIELLVKNKTQVILGWNNDLLLKKVTKGLKGVNIPVVMIDSDKIENMPKSFSFLGKLLNMEQRGGELASYAKESTDYITKITKNIPEEKRVSFYYAEGPNGLQSDCEYSFHTSQFRFINAKNIYECSQKDIMGMESINFEAVLKADPDVIIVQSPKFYKDIFKSKKWMMLGAVKEKRVYLVPRIPYNWIDRPPSFMRLLGIHWLSSIIYPEYYTKDIDMEIKKFYKIFLMLSLTNKSWQRSKKGLFSQKGECFIKKVG